MSTRVALFVPEGVELPASPELEDVPVSPIDEAAQALAEGRCDAAVLVTDGLAPDALAALADTVARAGKPVIEVQSERWDGEQHSPLTAVCRGVIAGFGPAAAGRAVRLLRGA